MVGRCRRYGFPANTEREQGRVVFGVPNTSSGCSPPVAPVTQPSRTPSRRGSEKALFAPSSAEWCIVPAG